MDNFDLKKYLVENKLTSNNRVNEEDFDITKEVQLGDVLVDAQGDMYEVVAISPSQVELEPFNFKGNNSIFPDDFGNDVTIEDFWQHLTASNRVDEAETGKGQLLRFYRLSDPDRGYGDAGTVGFVRMVSPEYWEDDSVVGS